MALSDQIKVPAQVKGAVGGGGGGSVSADEILTALGSGKWPVFRMDSVGGSANAITASVSGLTLTSGQYFWLVPASNSSSTTVNLNLNSGGNVRVKKADGSTDPASGDLQAGVIALLYYDGTYYRQMTGMPVSATDSTKLPLAGGTMTGALKMSGTVNIDAASMEMYPAGSGLLYRNVPTGGLYGECVNGAEVYRLGAAGIAFPYAHSTPGTNVVGVYRDGSGNLCLGVDSGAGLIAKVAGSRAGGFPLTPSDMPLANCPLLVAATTFASNGTWTNLFELSAGAYKGDFFLYTSITRGCGKYPVTGTTLAGSTDSTGAGLFVDSGFEGSAYVALRVNSGWLQIYVGTGVLASTKFGLGFQGIVV